ncbi:NitT/TauT family transport system ATP-binding protein [Lipingzhangella halophila]|uniref:NitT/TauT family transport system ATP-binding protein n=1 Tax=Lipingzhangella halophila TaxID=1783352 RepID=A0A7W7RGI0_9ACTN|nr:ABC transporter ATP-binding protein [Lipingzhangella halophila]MBB4931223.1 NitT/TauT family transport system ATP-binding protein [Lipingzhangella halophila]
MLRVESLRKVYEEGTRNAVEAVAEVSATVEEQEFVSIVGPSGAGKTTLLKCVAGLLPYSSGSVYLDDELVTEPPKKMALVFQDYSRSLYPWMTVRENVAFPLKPRGLDRSAMRTLVGETLQSVGLDGAGAKYPWQLSGGMQQRVAIARALAYQPEILLMDEPFASVDAQTRADLEDLVLDVRDQYGVTVLFVTHDIDEAVYLSDRVVVLTSAPTRVAEIVDVGLPRPRDQVGTKERPDFARLRGYVWRSIRRPDQTASTPA